MEQESAHPSGPGFVRTREAAGRDLIVVRAEPPAAPGPDGPTRPVVTSEVEWLRRQLEAARREAEACRSRHAEEMSTARRQLFEARQQASLGELLGTTTHEFNNALTTILNYARMGLRHRDQATRDKALERILSAGTRAAKITASVLSLARGRPNRFEPTDLTLLVEDVLVLLEREMMKYRVQVEREFAPVPRVSANPAQIQQVLLNLLVNARQAMPGGGRLIVRLAHDEPGGLVDMMVRDTGCGMTPDVMRRIFDPHFTTKSGPDETGKGGTGLGLTACREIVEAHRGRIRVESAPGKGTAITIRLPVLQAAAA
jgi:signal transduction histidine kinase